MKLTDYKIIRELLKNSRRSDRELARILGISQPTVTRRRAKIEKNFIDGYTAVPIWEKIGLEIIAFTFVKHKIKFVKADVREEVFRSVREWLKRQPNVILAIDGQGMGWDAIFVSIHRNYTDFTEFINKHNSELSEFLIDTQSFISNYNPSTVKKRFHLKYLSEMI